VAERLVIEVDGDTHREAYDLRRDAWLEAHGWSVMHVPVQDLDENFDDVVESICARLHPREAESLYDPKFASPLRPEPLRG
jgi:very-short-patch-repair endonuclease